MRFKAIVTIIDMILIIYHRVIELIRNRERYYNDVTPRSNSVFPQLHLPYFQYTSKQRVVKQHKTEVI